MKFKNLIKTFSSLYNEKISDHQLINTLKKKPTHERMQLNNKNYLITKITDVIEIHNELCERYHNTIRYNKTPLKVFFFLVTSQPTLISL